MQRTTANSRVVVRYSRSVPRKRTWAPELPQAMQALMPHPSGSAGWPESAGAPRAARAAGSGRIPARLRNMRGAMRSARRSPRNSARAIRHLPASPGKCAVSPPPSARFGGSRGQPHREEKRVQPQQAPRKQLQRQQKTVALDQFEARGRAFPMVAPRWCRTTASGV